MSGQYLAHIAEDGRTQTVLEHCMETAKLAASFADAFDAGEQGYLAGLSHDLGKYSSGFQKRLQGGKRVDHSTAGMQECWKTGQWYASFCVAGHHTGLLNMGSRTNTQEDGTMYGRLVFKPDDYSAFHKDITLPSVPIPSYCGKSMLTDAFFVRMLFSSLTDADFLNTEQFMSGSRVQQHDTVEVLWRKLEQYIAPWFPGNTELNIVRSKILSSVIEKGSCMPSGLYSLTVPTGGGKTVASMALALRHALHTGKKRIIYVIPYTSIIEQTAQKFREIFGKENVLEHHCNVPVKDNDEMDDADLCLAKAVENWDMPIVVTTSVQFFESLFSNKSSRCRKLHNIANSVIIFDEAQQIPIPYLQPCVYAIAELVQHYYATAVLCTATQPALDKQFLKYLPDQKIEELCPKELSENPAFSRVRFENAGYLDWDTVCGKMNRENQVLCIVNSRKNAKQVFDSLDPQGRFHLSTLMCPQHRSEILKTIRSRLEKGETCRVVATSLIEAGVDVDFPRVLREEAGLDSVIQAGGRCNREGKKPVEDSIVTVFRSETPAAPMFSIPIGAARQALRSSDPLDAPATIRRYFQTLLDLKGPAELDRKNILEKLGKTFAFADVGKEFRLIETDTRIVYIPNAENTKEIAAIQSGICTKEDFRTLGRYAVNIYPQHYNALAQAGDILPVENGVAILLNTNLYSKENGLSLEADSGKGIFV